MADTRRAFICNDELWEKLAAEANRQEKVVDDLICEAMEKYLQDLSAEPASIEENSQSEVPLEQAPPRPPLMPPSTMPPSILSITGGSAPYQPPIPPAPSYVRQNAVAQQAGRQSPPSYGAMPSVPSSQSSSSAPSVQPYGASVLNELLPPSNTAGYRRPPSMYENDSFNSGQQLSVPPSSMSIPPAPPAAPMPSAAPMPPAAPHMTMPPQQPSAYAVSNSPQMMQISGQPPLYILFANQRYTVDKDKFIIGRSSQLADLVIRDGNISRKHCAIIFKGGAYYIKDLDSTNGIEYKGQRIDAKRIDEGDQFNICEFQFTFTYKN